MAFWTDEKTTLLKTYWATNSASELAPLLGVSRSAVIGKANRLGLPAKEPCGRKLTPKNVREMRRMWAERRFTQTRLALIFGVHKDTISGVVQRRTYKHIA